MNETNLFFMCFATPSISLVDLSNIPRMPDVVTQQNSPSNKKQIRKPYDSALKEFSIPIFNDKNLGFFKAFLLSIEENI